MTQAHTFILHTPLDPDQLKLRSLSGAEGLSLVSAFTLDLYSPSADINANDLLGQGVTLEIITQSGSSRYLNAIVTGFAYLGPDSGADVAYRYEAQLGNWLWLADKKSDSRVFLEKDIPSIVKASLVDFGMPFEMDLTGTYPPIEYVVQFQETNLNFVKRLTEQAGIYWYVTHTKDSHTIVFCDGQHPELPEHASIPFLTPHGPSLQADEYIFEWEIRNEVKSGSYVANSYNFKSPKANLQQDETVPKDHANDTLEIYEYNGNYPDRGVGAQHVRVRREQQQLEHEIITCKGNVRDIAPGYTFTLTDHPRKQANIEYLIVKAKYYFQERYDTTRQSDGGTKWRIELTVRPAKDRYYPRRTTDKTPIVGAHTAVVTGPAGQEIWCDNYGRVKVQFSWDRHGQNDENSSCWVRSSSPWAGSNFGGVNIPRIGQEVLIEYIHGDIDLPVIVGRVYNQGQMPPWDLPGSATQSGFLSRSSPGGQYGHANAIRFEDKKGAEQVWIQAERNMDTQVENDETHHVMHDRTKTVDHDETVFVHHDRTETVDHNETITVHNNRQERVDQNETVSIGGNRTEDVGQNETLKVGANRAEVIVANESVTIGGSRTVTIAGAKAETVALAKAETIGLAKALTIGAAYQVSVGAAMNTTVALIQAAQIGMDKSTMVGKSYKINVGTKYVLEAGEEIVLKTGEASITLKSDGTIVLKGKELQSIGENIALKADSDIKLKASKIDNN